MPKSKFYRAALLIAVAAAGLVGEGAALAQTPAARANAAIPVTQRIQTCGACHGADGNSAIPNFPSLAGQPKVFIETQLIMIREGLRPVPSMAGMLDGVSDRDITAMATHYAAQTVVSSPAPLRAAQAERGRVVAGQMQCASCHLPSYAGREQMPRLAGQREDYLAYSMKLFRDGKAAGRDTIMSAALHGASDGDIDAMAHYLALQK